jgi:phospholipid-transporting ATPase
MNPPLEIELQGSSTSHVAKSVSRDSRAGDTESPRSPPLSPRADGAPMSLISKMRINDGIENPHGLSNRITTTKYSLLSWLPKSLFEQFRRVANIYFLGISILMLIGTYAPVVFTTPLEPFSTLGTLIFVLLVTSVKEGYEDVKRARSDELENTRRITVCSFDENGKLVETETETQYIKSGDIIKLRGHCQVPADLVLIMTSFFDDGNKCYVETANIDGETNLKLREAPSALLEAVKSGQVRKELFHGHLEFEPPNKNIHNFIGTLYIDNMEPVPLCADNLLLRASIFSNTEWGYGVAVYTGNETKIQMNNRQAPSKMSKLEQYVNEAIILIFFAQVILVSISIISLYATGFQDESKLPYVFPPDVDVNSNASALPLWLEQWFVFFILYNNFIPISLYVTIELVNLGQGYLMSTDLNMYEESVDMPCVVRSSNLAQELGVVSNIFSDKTGTLTRNEMRFVKFVVGNKMFEVTDEGADSIMQEAKRGSDETSKKVYDFFFCLATCHTVIREKNGTYRAESPDELALVEGVGRYKCGIQERGTSHMLVDMMGQIENYDVLAVNAFNSDRKRMSILLRQKNTNMYKLLCKGADSVMIDLLALSTDERHTVDKSLLDLASIGLRTLVVASKDLPEQDALAWVEKWKNAASSLQDRADRLASAAEEIEQQMTLLGITAIEDRLQDEVPEVIAELAEAGIVLWMLTGDKEETAISIGHSCNLLTPTTELHFLARIKTDDEYYETLKAVHDTMAERVEGSKEGTVPELALVMDGPSFKHFNERNPVHRQYLLKIGQMCRSVIACRLTPVQKQQLVALVKVDSKPKATTLSIGDGANDVSMIREADVGVGIIGKEGRQAANNADFAIGQFKFLRSLLLIHGRWNYIRQSRVFLYSMHKNMAITLTLFWFR